MTEDGADKKWFELWFDSPYYHQLYGNRDYREADLFVRALVKKLNLQSNQKVLDLACGKGRHAQSLNQMGLDVVGVDLAPQSIAEAKKQGRERLEFFVHDMRQVIPGYHFDVVLNLFTSFGYFDHDAENLKVLQAVHEMLEDQGILVIDFMNAQRVIQQLVKQESKTIDGISFELRRWHDERHIFKQIDILDGDIKMSHQEQVQVLYLSDFKALLEAADMELLETWGSYQLTEFDPEKSDRLIILARKK